MDLPPPEWLVGDLIPEGGLAQIYGAQKRSKTFVTLDMALCVATADRSMASRSSRAG